MTNKILNIGFDASYAFGQRSGTSVYSHNLLTHLSKIDKINKYIIFPFFEYHFLDNYQQYHPILSSNFKIYLKSFPKLFTSIFWKYLIPKLDIFHSTTFTIPEKRISDKLVVTIYDTTFYTHPQYHQQANIDHCMKATINAVVQADKIIAISQQTKSDLINYFDCPESKIAVTYMACDEIFYSKVSATSINTVIKKFNLVKPYIFHLGSLEPRKNTLGLIKAYLLMPDNYQKQFDLVIAGGGGWMNNEIINYINCQNTFNRIKLIGYISTNSLVALLQHASCFAYPSFYEGFGIPCLEAMAAGCPVLTSNTSSLPEVCGNSALYCNPLDVENISENLTSILTQNNTKKIALGKQLAKNFSWTKCAEETLDIYQSI